MARDVVDAIESVVPLRRCTVRMGRNYRAPDGAPVCSAAQLGFAQCPCSGSAEPESYAIEVQRVVRVMSGETHEVVEKLTSKMRKHSQAQRFEEAGDILSRIGALESVLRRVQTAHDLVNAGKFDFVAAPVAVGATDFNTSKISYQIDRGLLRTTHVDGSPFSPVAPPIKVDFDELFNPRVINSTTAPISAELIDEILCIARHARTSVNSQDPANTV